MKKAECIARYGEEEYRRRLEYCKEYRKQHKKQAKEYREQHKEEHKQYRESNKQKKKEYDKKYRENNKEKTLGKYVENGNIEAIENYQLAKADNFKGWCIHHRLECIETGAVVNSTYKDLIDWGIYYDRPADELIFLRKGEHRALHNIAITQK